VARTTDTKRMPTHTTHSAAGSLANSAAELRVGDGGYKRRVWLGIGGALMVLVGVLLYLDLDGAGQRPSAAQAPEEMHVLATIADEVPTADSTQAGVDAAVEGPGQDERDGSNAELVQTPSIATDEAVLALVAEAQEARKNKDWALAMAKAQQVLQLAPGHAEATETLNVAEQEQVNALRFQELEESLRTGDLETAASRLAALPESSVYRRPARNALTRANDDLQTELVTAMTQARRWRDAGKCDDIKTLQSSFTETRRQLRLILEECKHAQKSPASSRLSNADASQSTTASAVPSSAAPAKSASTNGKPASSDDSFNELLSEAQEAAKRGFYGKAHRLCRDALDIQPGEPRALEVCTIAACNLGHAAVAKGYYTKLPTSRRSSLHRLCRARGIDLEQ
jgi:hypothetical protein